MTRFLDYETGRDPSAPKRSRKPYPVTAPDLFAAEVIATPTSAILGMVRGEGSIESQAACLKVLPKLTAIQCAILSALAHDGPQTARELENRKEFHGLAPSSARKRISELRQSGQIEQAGRRDGMAIWILTPTQVTR